MKQDVEDEAFWPTLMSEVHTKFGGLDVLVNNAGFGDLAKGNSPEDTSPLTAYGASKAAVLQLSKSIALHCAQPGYKIRCNTIHPGQVTTPMHDGIMRDISSATGAPEENVRADSLSRIPIGEFGETRDIADAALFLARLLRTPTK